MTTDPFAKYDRAEWLKVERCGCACHDSKFRALSHDNLCCPRPNARKVENPFPRASKPTKAKKGT